MVYSNMLTVCQHSTDRETRGSDYRMLQRNRTMFHYI